jgi:glycine betaine catabolism B
MAMLELHVQTVKMETPTIKSVRVSLGDQPFSFKPGQYCLVQIPVGSEQEDRSLSIANSPTRPDSLLFATRYSESPYKRAFFSLKPGDRVTITGPTGRFVYDEGASHTVLLSGGIGITPLKSMIEYVCDRQFGHPVLLLYGNHSPREIPFCEELDDLYRANENFTLVHTVSSVGDGGETWHGHTGRITEELIRQYVINPMQARYFICGPPGMVSGLRSLLEQMDLPSEQIQFENFDGYE